MFAPSKSTAASVIDISDSSSEGSSRHRDEIRSLADMTEDERENYMAEVRDDADFNSKIDNCNADNVDTIFGDDCDELEEEEDPDLYNYTEESSTPQQDSTSPNAASEPPVDTLPNASSEPVVDTLSNAISEPTVDGNASDGPDLNDLPGLYSYTNNPTPPQNLTPNAAARRQLAKEVYKKWEELSKKGGKGVRQEVWKEYKAWCDVIGKRDQIVTNYKVTDVSLAAYLQWVHQRCKKNSKGEDREGTRLSKSSMRKQFTSLLHISKRQRHYDPKNWKDPATPEVKVLIKVIYAQCLLWAKENASNDYLDNTLLDRYSFCEKNRIQMALLSVKDVKCATRDAFTFAWQSQTMNRSDSIRSLVLPGLHLYDFNLDNGDSVTGVLAIYRNIKGIQADDNTPVYNLVLPHRDPLHCSVAFLAVWLHYYLDKRKEHEVIDWTDNTTWYNKFAIWGSKPDAQLSLNNHWFRFDKAFKEAKVPTRAKTHAPRKSEPAFREKAGVESAQTKRAGHWNNAMRTFEKTYCSDIPYDDVRAAAGFQKLEPHIIPRLNVEVPPQFTSKLFPWVEGELKRVEELGSQYHKATVSFLKLLIWLRKHAILLLPYILRDCGPRNAILSLPFVTADLVEWARPRTGRFWQDLKIVEEQRKTYSLKDVLMDPSKFYEILMGLRGDIFEIRKEILKMQKRTELFSPSKQPGRPIGFTIYDDDLDVSPRRRRTAMLRSPSEDRFVPNIPPRRKNNLSRPMIPSNTFTPIRTGKTQPAQQPGTPSPSRTTTGSSSANTPSSSATAPSSSQSPAAALPASSLLSSSPQIPKLLPPPIAYQCRNGERIVPQYNPEESWFTILAADNLKNPAALFDYYQPKTLGKFQSVGEMIAAWEEGDIVERDGAKLQIPPYKLLESALGKTWRAGASNRNLWNRYCTLVFYVLAMAQVKGSMRRALEMVQNEVDNGPKSYTSFQKIMMQNFNRYQQEAGAKVSRKNVNTYNERIQEYVEFIRWKFGENDAPQNAESTSAEPSISTPADTEAPLQTSLSAINEVQTDDDITIDIDPAIVLEAGLDNTRNDALPKSPLPPVLKASSSAPIADVTQSSCNPSNHSPQNDPPLGPPSKLQIPSSQKNPQKGRASKPQVSRPKKLPLNQKDIPPKSPGSNSQNGPNKLTSQPPVSNPQNGPNKPTSKPPVSSPRQGVQKLPLKPPVPSPQKLPSNQKDSSPKSQLSNSPKLPSKRQATSTSTPVPLKRRKLAPTPPQKPLPTSDHPIKSPDPLLSEYRRKLLEGKCNVDVTENGLLYFCVHCQELPLMQSNRRRCELCDMTMHAECGMHNDKKELVCQSCNTFGDVQFPKTLEEQTQLQRFAKRPPHSGRSTANRPSTFIDKSGKIGLRRPQTHDSRGIPLVLTSPKGNSDSTDN